MRSGIVESQHDRWAIAVDADRSVIAQWGGPHERVLDRSAVKAFQATVSNRIGAGLITQQMAMACSSHSAPVLAS
jgi:L-asparaginase II